MMIAVRNKNCRERDLKRVKKSRELCNKLRKFLLREKKEKKKKRNNPLKKKVTD